MIKDSKNSNKRNVLMEYIFDMTINKGEIYIIDDAAVALWEFEKKEKRTIKNIIRDIRFLKEIGLKSVKRAAELEKMIMKNYPTKFCHLYLIGVLTECQGKGYSSKLINHMIEKMKNEKVSIYLETAVKKNIEIYSKKGFMKFSKIVAEGHGLYLMKKEA